MTKEASQSWLGRRPPPGLAVDLAFPLQGGTYLVANGGSVIGLNAHLASQQTANERLKRYRGNGYAIDLVKLDGWGLRARGVVPVAPDAYYIFGEPVLAPCSGNILRTHDGAPDMPVPQVDRQNIAGNYVFLRCGDYEVVLAHFQPGSLLVKIGDQVKVGQRLALVGNSGVSNEPHLHLHAQRPGPADAPFAGEPIPMRFADRFLVRNDRVSVQAKP